MVVPASSPITKYRDDSRRILRKWSDSSWALTDSAAMVPDCSWASQALHGAVFVGHVNTDLDSVAGAIGAAALFNGTAAIAEPADKLNGEIKHGLKASGLEVPRLFDDIVNEYVEKHGEDMPGFKICLVDHTERKQMTNFLQEDSSTGANLRKKICGVIDHHALAQNFSTDSPIFMDLRPWGSMSTIVAHLFLQENKKIDPKIAKILLSAILSDTLNLKSPTTTEADKFAVTLLAHRAGRDKQLSLKRSQRERDQLVSKPAADIEDKDSERGEFVERESIVSLSTNDVTSYAMDLFRAKTEWICSLGPKQMASADIKAFEVVDKKGDIVKFGIGVLEIAGSPQPVLAHTEALVEELRLVKKTKGWGMIYLCVVDVISQTSVVICPEEKEMELTKKAFSRGDDAAVNATVVEIGNFASRKKQFLPMYTKVKQEI